MSLQFKSASYVLMKLHLIVKKYLQEIQKTSPGVENSSQTFQLSGVIIENLDQIFQ